MRKAILTGASSGIGRELARALLAEQLELIVLLGRMSDRLIDCQKELEYLFPDAQVSLVFCDLAEASVEEIQRLIDLVWSRYGKFDIVINCAGTAYQERFCDSDMQRLEQMMRVNLLAPLVITKACAALMQRHRIKGKIILISSLMGLLAAPSFASYSATKFGLVGFARAVRKELADSDIQVSLALPGLTATPMVESFVKLPGLHYLSTSEVARAIVRRLIRGSSMELIIGWQGYLGLFVKTLAPALFELVMRELSPLNRKSRMRSTFHSLIASR